MKVIVLASLKGGSGKTTLSGHLAVEAERAGAGPVALIDMDPQGSLSDWWNARKGESPRFAKVGSQGLDEVLQRLRGSGVNLAIIDTPAAITQTISEGVAQADLVLVPTRPSPHDLRAVGATVDIADHHRKPLVFVINAATARARITGESAVALSQHGTVAPVMLHQRVEFAASMVDGHAVGEITPASMSAREVRDLWAYVQDRLQRLSGERMGTAVSLSRAVANEQLVAAMALSPAQDEGLPPVQDEVQSFPEPDENPEPVQSYDEIYRTVPPPIAEREPERPFAMMPMERVASSVSQETGLSVGDAEIVTVSSWEPKSLPPIRKSIEPAVEVETRAPATAEENGSEPERRNTADRRKQAGFAPSGIDRRNGLSFGRRSQDRVVPFGKLGTRLEPN